jgi:hypothetical protein
MICKMMLQQKYRVWTPSEIATVSVVHQYDWQLYGKRLMIFSGLKRRNFG